MRGLADREIADLSGNGQRGAILVIASGANRVNEKTLAGLAGGKIERGSGVCACANWVCDRGRAAGGAQHGV